MTRNRIAILISYLLAVLFAYAAIAKLADFTTFRAELRQSPILGRFGSTLAWAVPGIELTTVLALLIPAWRMIGLYGSILLLGAFTIYIGGLLSRTDPVSCDCGGLLEGMDLSTHIWFNIIFLAMGLTALMLDRHNKDRPV